MFLLCKTKSHIYSKSLQNKQIDSDSVAVCRRLVGCSSFFAAKMFGTLGENYKTAQNQNDQLSSDTQTIKNNYVYNSVFTFLLPQLFIPLSICASH